jgi:prevent-host-death family protein
MERVMTEEYITPEDSPVVRLDVAELRDRLDDILTRVGSGEERAILSRDGEDVAAVISIEEFWFLERAIARLEDEMDLEAIREAKAEAEKKGTISWETLKSELGL